MLNEIELHIDQSSHKLINPADTRWLSHEASVEVICKHYTAICLALEHIYQEAGDLSCDAGGLLLTLRKRSTIFLFSLLSRILKPLARLSKSLQSSSGDILNAMEHANAVIAYFGELVDSNFDTVSSEADEMYAKAISNSLYIEIDNVATPQCDLLCASQKYVQAIITNMKTRFSDDVGRVAGLHMALKSKTADANFSDVSRIFNLPQHELEYEWRMLRRLDGDMSATQSLLKLCASEEKCILFPIFSKLARKILLMPIGTAGVERSFSTMNRVLNSDRCRLLPQHVDALMKVSIEGPSIPDIRDGTEQEHLDIDQLVQQALAKWNMKPRR